MEYFNGMLSQKISNNASMENPFWEILTLFNNPGFSLTKT